MKRTSSQTLSKRLLTAAAIVGLAASGTQVANAVNVLFNGTLDQIAISDQNNATPVGWNTVASKSFSGPGYMDGGDSEPWCNVSPPSDLNGNGFFFKPFSGSLGPPADLLSVSLYQDNPATPGTKFTLAANTACEASYSGLFNTNTPPPATVLFIEFRDSGGTLLATNEYDLIAAGISQGGPGGMAASLMTTPQYTAPANTATVRAGMSLRNVYSTSGGQSIFVDNFDLESIAPPGSPDITNQPAQVSVAAGATAKFRVDVSNPSGVSYQWQFYNTNIANVGEYSGATSNVLTITGVSAGDVGHYRALVSNTSGSVYSTDGVLTVVDFDVKPVITLTGKLNDTYRVDYTTNIASGTWIPLSTNKLTSSPLLVTDPASARTGTRFYRAVFLH